MEVRFARGTIMPLLLAGMGATLALTTTLPAAGLLLLGMIAAGICWWSILKPQRWLFLFFAVLLLSPPVPFPVGDAGAHPAPAIALLGVFAALTRLRGWMRSLPPVALALCSFLGVIVLSAGMAALYSGVAIASGSLMRAALFALSVFVFLFALCGPRESAEDSLRVTRFLFGTAVAAAVFACIDYYYQMPAPAGFGPQFIWLDEGVFRRAQGLFYEASTLGNFCAFFLVMIAVCMFRGRNGSPLPMPMLTAGTVVLGAALVLSYSRASLLNVLVALCALGILRRGEMRKTLVAGLASLALGVIAIGLMVPSFFASYLHRLSATLQYFWDSPDGVLSGRLSHWQIVTDFLLREPIHAIFGVGYKTLPYSDFIGARVIADNTWLSLLAETGLVGLTVFGVFNVLLLQTALQAARSTVPRAAFYGQWMFCFWCGELAQMMSGDLITYWRVLPVYFWVLGTAMREQQENA